MNAIAALRDQGQSIWLDYIRRTLLTSGKLKALLEDEGVTGVTANPTIFEKAIVGSTDYDAAIHAEIERRPELPLPTLYERLAVDDVRQAADILRPVYDRTDGVDGYVSLEVSPGTAHDTAATVSEAHRLWKEVDRPNLLIKVPATPEGIPAVEQLIGDGINVNITLMFSRAQYEAVAGAFLRGLARTPDPARIASVASYFVSRVDTPIDRALDAMGTPAARALRGRIAIANCRLVYRRYQEIFHGPEFEPWRARGARPQRLLWASTSTKDPAYRDTMYVEELIGPETVNTIPPATLDAFRDHGTVRGATIAEGVDQAAADLDALASLGVRLDPVTSQLLVDGVHAFDLSFQAILDALEGKRSALLSAGLRSLPWNLAPADAAVQQRLVAWQAADFGHGLWRKDPSFWPKAPPSDVASRLGWLTLPETMHGQIEELDAFAAEIRAEGFRHAVVLGMGGSSLAPDVFAATFGPAPGHPELLVLDTTHPDAVEALAERLDLKRTLFLVSSKSGSTLEPLSFFRLFWDRVRPLGDSPGRQFVAITDPGTSLESLATERKFRRVFRAPPDVGGRFSALTVFGLVPAAVLGVDLRRLLDRAFRMAEASAFCVPVASNPAFVLGAALGELARAGRDKVTFLAVPPYDAFPDWTEQLIAESTGKNGTGIVPVVGEPVQEPADYGADRVFVSLLPAGGGGPATTLADRLAAAGHPVLRFPIDEREQLGGEFFRWEGGIAAAGSVLGIDPFDQPDVELAKELARQAMADPAGGAPVPAGVSVAAADPGQTRAALDTWASGLGPSDYLGVQAYLAPSAEMDEALTALRRTLLQRYRRATTLGYGPRFLHSTGQLHKGGPQTGRFLQLMDEVEEDLAVPETDYTFGRLIRAQALGDLLALRQRGRTVLRVELGRDPLTALRAISEQLRG